ncbi:MAG: Fpg/Nei family DNA glycosylase [Kineosporiaceae bacterium]|nr:Fpg/Nei family DNA glycosylase [Kineosporiaceae bacterium]
MPEGDVVWRTAQRLHAALAGHRLTTWDLRWPSLATTDLRGGQVLEVVSAGKHLLCRIERDERRLTLHSHLRMEGSWHVHRTGTGSGAGRLTEPDIRAVLGTESWTAVGHRLGMLDLVATGDEHTLVGHLGPDVLGSTWAPDVVLGILARQPSRAIGDLLLDQRVLAGVGTFYMAEALFLRGVSPWTPAGDLPPDSLSALVDLVHRLMAANRDRAVQITTGDARQGRTHYVHARSGRPCRRCGDTVRVAMIGQAPRDRTAFFCPRCQPGPAPAAAAAHPAPLGARRRGEARIRRR